MQNANKRILLARRNRFAALSCAVISLAIGVFAQAPAAKTVGTVKSVSSNSVVITTDSGAETTVTFAESARIVRATPGQTDLKSATPIQVSDIQVGDRILVRGQTGAGGTVIASSALVMKKTDVAERQRREREEWRRGIGGIVKGVDAPTGTITLANSLAASGKPIAVHTSPQTVFRRYAPDSIKFDEAKPGTLDQIKPGDQLRARGTKNADGTEFAAQAIVSGTFRDIAGTVISTDAVNNTVTVMDLMAKKTVAVKVNSDSELHKLPPFVAARIAMRLKGGATDAAAPASGATGPAPPANAPAGGWQRGRAGDRGSRAGASAEAAASAGDAGPGGNGHGNGGPPDFQQMLSRMPALAISELNKGDAVMLVATEGSASSEPNVITLLAGVEPILSAAPGRASMILSPWNLGGGEGGDAAAP